MEKTNYQEKKTVKEIRKSKVGIGKRNITRSGNGQRGMRRITIARGSVIDRRNGFR